MNPLIACCGLDCEACDARIATITNDNALRELSDGFCQALGCQKRKYDEVFNNMKYGNIERCGILSRLWVELRGNKPSFTYCVGQDGGYEYPLVKKILYRGY